MNYRLTFSKNWKKQNETWINKFKPWRNDYSSVIVNCFSCVYCFNNHSKATYSEQRHRIDDLTDCQEKLKLQRDIQASRVKELQAKGTAIMIKESPAEQLKKMFTRQTNQLVPRRTAKKIPRTNTATNMVACCFCQRDNCTPLLISDCGLLFNPSCMEMSNLDPEWFSDGECDLQI